MTKVTHTAAKQYKVAYQRDETGWWQARVPEVPGCHTQGRTIDQARRRIREALSLFVDDAETAELHDEVALPRSAARAIDTYKKLRERADEQAQKASQAARSAVEVLQAKPLNMSLRDAAGVLEISHQRVYQLRQMPPLDMAMARGKPDGEKTTRRRDGAHHRPARTINASDRPPRNRR